jgi:hypothetical protein
MELRERAMMNKFEPGDIVQVEYRTPRAIVQWMDGERAPGPGDIGVVKFASPDSILNVPDWGLQLQQQVTVTFPTMGTYGVHSSNLKIVHKREDDFDTDMWQP